MLSRLGASDLESIPQLAAALTAAFPFSAQPWAQEIAGLADLATNQPPALHDATRDLRRRLGSAPLAPCDRPPLLIPSRALADRLVRGRGEHEDPIGAATGL